MHDAGAAVCRRLVRGASGEPSHAVAVRLSRRRGPEDLIYDAARRATHSSMPEMTRAEVEAALAAAPHGQGADFSGKRLSGLDLSALDFSGANLPAARLCAVERVVRAADVIGAALRHVDEMEHEVLADLGRRIEPTRPTSVVYIASAMPPLISPIEDFIIDLSRRATRSPRHIDSGL